MKIQQTLIAALLLISIQHSLMAQAYRYHADLVNVTEDRVMVELTPPPLADSVATFCLPSIVPGTYSIYDFGRFVENFKALDAEGKPLAVSHPDANTWVISGAGRLSRISYEVNDTWDDESGENPVFEPGGTNIEAGENFVVNGHGFFGFFKGMENRPFEVTFTRPSHFFGASALTPERLSSSQDLFRARNYFQLIDSPIMYCAPDTAYVNVGGAKVLFATYSAEKEVTADVVAKEVQPILEAQRKYLGGTLPVDHYAFIIYLFQGFGGLSGSYGALEHNHCSFYFLPEYSITYLAETLRDFSAHEFFHIVTPLSIHAEQIHNFDFITPKMSEHLWLYEGVTEYFAGHVQASYGIIDLEEYLETLQEKVVTASGYNEEIAFTEMSSKVLDEYKEEYGNVYQKGALIGLCLDLTLRKASNGSFGLRDLMAKLMKEYGPEKPFRDEDLFAEIGRLSYPEAEKFLRDHVGTASPLPLTALLEEVGIQYAETITTREWTLGGIMIDVNEENRLWVTETYDIDDFGRKMGYKEGDILMKFAGEDLRASNAERIIGEYFTGATEGTMLEIEVSRPKRPGSKKYKTVTLSAPLEKVESTLYYVMDPLENATPAQLKLREAWLINE